MPGDSVAMEGAIPLKRAEGLLLVLETPKGIKMLFTPIFDGAQISIFATLLILAFI